jgi:hypothetical protein
MRAFGTILMEAGGSSWLRPSPVKVIRKFKQMPISGWQLKAAKASNFLYVTLHTCLGEDHWQEASDAYKRN